ncbi:hypothetical protein CRUP_019213 [Coryphaenoides rupestris]|nr:hypothetical protein CRUP_019213 [Coryphaenoides rupestris]
MCIDRQQEKKSEESEGGPTQGTKGLARLNPRASRAHTCFQRRGITKQDSPPEQTFQDLFSEVQLARQVGLITAIIRQKRYGEHPGSVKVKSDMKDVFSPGLGTTSSKIEEVEDDPQALLEVFQTVSGWLASWPVVEQIYRKDPLDRPGSRSPEDRGTGCGRHSEYWMPVTRWLLRWRTVEMDSLQASRAPPSASLKSASHLMQVARSSWPTTKDISEGRTGELTGMRSACPLESVDRKAGSPAEGDRFYRRCPQENTQSAPHTRRGCIVPCPSSVGSRREDVSTGTTSTSSSTSTTTTLVRTPDFALWGSQQDDNKKYTSAQLQLLATSSILSSQIQGVKEEDKARDD